MDYDKMALFLSACTTPAFRRSLGTAPRDALERVGFQGAEIGQLAASLTRARGSGSAAELTQVGFTYRKIQLSNQLGKKGLMDDWWAA
jgi:hypothetical protein